MTERDWRIVGKRLRLSPREFQIVQAVFDDLNEAAIAEQLELSAHTVHSYLIRLYRKLGVRSRCELIVRVFAEYVDVHPVADGYPLTG